MSTDYQYAVIGAGVVGLAIAAELAPRGSVLVLEKEWKFGQATSSHNSEVVHGGLYYAPQSLKARLCVEGNRMIQELAATHGIGYKRVGKFVVAVNEEELTYLEWLKANGEASGVNDLRWVTPDELWEVEPSVKSVACLHSPNSGIVDSHALMVLFKNVAEQAGTDFVFNATVTGIRGLGRPSPSIPHPSSLIPSSSGGYILSVRDADGAAINITADCVINAAGLHSDEIAAMAGMNVQELGIELLWTRGFYYTPENPGRLHISHLVYPVPEKGLKSLGVHATVDLQGAVRFGPTAEYMKKKVEDYSFADAEITGVAEAIERYLPAIEGSILSPMMTGIRPKLTRPGEAPRDFYIREESDHGLPGFVNLIGIESPGLTAAPAIAKMVGGMLKNGA